jgi:hypothetical protein
MLNFNTGGGSFTPYINYMASIQGWEMSGEDGKQNFTFKQAVFDLNSIQTGWQRWPEGGTPEWVMDESVEIPAPKPEGKGTTSVPTLVITKWIDTPEELSVVEEVSAVPSLAATQVPDDGLGNSDEDDEF